MKSRSRGWILGGRWLSPGPLPPVLCPGRTTVIGFDAGGAGRVVAEGPVGFLSGDGVTDGRVLGRVAGRVVTEGLAEFLSVDGVTAGRVTVEALAGFLSLDGVTVGRVVGRVAGRVAGRVVLRSEVPDVEGFVVWRLDETAFLSFDEEVLEVVVLLRVCA